MHVRVLVKLMYMFKAQTPMANYKICVDYNAVHAWIQGFYDVK